MLRATCRRTGVSACRRVGGKVSYEESALSPRDNKTQPGVIRPPPENPCLAANQRTAL